MSGGASLEQRLDAVHKLVMRASAPVCIALVRRRANRAELVEAVEQLKLATNMLEEAIGTMPTTRHGGGSPAAQGED